MSRNKNCDLMLFSFMSSGLLKLILAMSEAVAIELKQLKTVTRITESRLVRWVGVMHA